MEKKKKGGGEWAKLFSLALLSTSLADVFKKGVYELSSVVDKLFLEIMSRFRSLSAEFKFELNPLSISELNAVKYFLFPTKCFMYCEILMHGTTPGKLTSPSYPDSIQVVQKVLREKVLANNLCTGY